MVIHSDFTVSPHGVALNKHIYKSFGIIRGWVNDGRILDFKKSRQACEEVLLFGLWSGEQLSSMCCWWSNRSNRSPGELWVCDMEVNRCTQRDHGNCWEKRGVCCATRNRECLFKESWSGTCPSRRDSTTYGQTISGHFGAVDPTESPPELVVLLFNSCCGGKGQI